MPIIRGLCEPTTSSIVQPSTSASISAAGSHGSLSSVIAYGWRGLRAMTGGPPWVFTVLRAEVHPESTNASASKTNAVHDRGLFISTMWFRGQNMKLLPAVHFRHRYRSGGSHGHRAKRVSWSVPETANIIIVVFYHVNLRTVRRDPPRRPPSVPGGRKCSIIAPSNVRVRRDVFSGTRARNRFFQHRHDLPPDDPGGEHDQRGGMS